MPSEQRSYADPCAVARALDAVGERWALLVVRELSLGPRRFGQLRHALPDLSPNVLSQRLRQLDAAGVVRRHELEPPASTVVYELTERGHGLDPVLQSLARWGAAEDDIDGREMSAVSFVRSLRVLVSPGAADGVWQLEVGGEPFVLEISGGRADAQRGRASAPLATVAGEIGALRQALLGAGWGAAVADGSVQVHGDRRAARRLAASFPARPAPARRG